CAYWSGSNWQSGLCTVDNQAGLDAGQDDFVACSCNHLSSYAVVIDKHPATLVGYNLWFYIPMGIAACVYLFVVIANCFFASNISQFSAHLQLHMLVAVFVFHIIYIVNAALSPSSILVNSMAQSNDRCIAVSVLQTYFFLCQFFWMLAQGALHGLGANKGRATGSVRGAGVSQQTVDITPSSRLTSPVGCLQREQQHLLHRLWAVRLGADEMACELESPTAHAAIECRVGDSLDADVEGGAQQTSVRRIDLLFETKGSPGKPAAASQVLASVWNQTAEVDELLTSREFGRLPVSASAKYCSLDVVRHAEHNGLLRVDHQADTRRNGNQPVQLPLGALDGRGQQGEVVGVAKHAEPLLRQMPRWSSSLVVPGFFGTATMCAVVHSLGAASPKSTRFITLATSAATQGMRSASMGTSSGPSAFPPGDCWASLTTSAALTGATLKLSSAGSGVSGGSVRLSGSGGGGALTMAAKNSRSSFLRSSGVSPARFSGLRRFRPSVDGGPGHAPSGIGPSGRDSLNGVIDSRLLALQVDSCQSCLCLAGWSPAQAELLQIFPRCLNRGVVLPDRLPTLSRLHHRDCLLRGGSDCSAHFRILGTSTLVAQRGVKGASKATLRIGGSERAVVAPRWPLRRTVERIAKVEVADEEPVIGPQSQRRDGAAVDGATTLTETHEHVVELCLSPGCVPATRVPSPPLAAHEGCETAQWLAEAGVGRHHVLPLQEVLQCLGVVVPAWRHEQRPLGPTQDCVQVSEGDRCPDVDPKQPGGQGDAATALLQPRPDQRSNSSTASLVRRSIVEGPPGAQVLTMKSRVGLDRHLLQRDDVAAQVVRQLRQHPSTPSSLESAAVQRPDPKHALWYGWGSMQLSLTVPGATRRIRVDPRGSSTGGATQPASSVPLTPALNTPTGAPLPSLGPAAFGRRSMLVMNDEHTNRNYHIFVIIGWVVPAVWVLLCTVISYAVFHNLFPNISPDQLVGSVNNNGFICYIKQLYVMLIVILLPILVVLVGLLFVFVNAYQVLPQWAMYDDICKGRPNHKEVRNLLIFWALLLGCTLFGGLHMAYSDLWWLIIYAVLEIITAAFALASFFALRGPAALLRAAAGGNAGQSYEIQEEWRGIGGSNGNGGGGGGTTGGSVGQRGIFKEKSAMDKEAGLNGGGGSGAAVAEENGQRRPSVLDHLQLVKEINEDQWSDQQPHFTGQALTFEAGVDWRSSPGYGRVDLPDDLEGEADVDGIDFEDEGEGDDDGDDMDEEDDVEANDIDNGDAADFDELIYALKSETAEDSSDNGRRRGQRRRRQRHGCERAGLGPAEPAQLADEHRGHASLIAIEYFLIVHVVLQHQQGRHQLRHGEHQGDNEQLLDSSSPQGRLRCGAALQPVGPAAAQESHENHQADRRGQQQRQHGQAAQPVQPLRCHGTPLRVAVLWPAGPGTQHSLTGTDVCSARLVEGGPLTAGSSSLPTSPARPSSVLGILLEAALNGGSVHLDGWTVADVAAAAAAVSGVNPFNPWRDCDASCAQTPAGWRDAQAGLHPGPLRPAAPAFQVAAETGVAHRLQRQHLHGRQRPSSLATRREMSGSPRALSSLSLA
uniref:GPS domain-containing protein n=1 Tax=Macrostomum lignano TaxID=282301 RepID=A0A1I8IIV8_9PLAT